MECFTRWLRKEEDPFGPAYRVFAALAGFAFVVAAIAAVVDASDGTLPTPAYVVVGFLFAITLFLSYRAVAALKHRHAGPPLERLHAAAWQGKLQEVLGDNAELLERSARNIEQSEALLPKLTIEDDLSRSLLHAANRRLRRMVDLTIHVPAHHGLTIERAGEQIQADAQWLEEMRILLESVSSGDAQREEDSTLSHLRSLVQAHEEASQELRA